ncbi:hypothetical protein M8J77_021299 [Diaphorina citri]|nr:hypothetical protein M8J77_021299 [Diaphorina citri]
MMGTTSWMALQIRLFDGPCISATEWYWLPIPIQWRLEWLCRSGSLMAHVSLQLSGIGYLYPSSGDWNGPADRAL